MSMWAVGTTAPNTRSSGGLNRFMNEGKQEESTAQNRAAEGIIWKESHQMGGGELCIVLNCA